MNYCITGSNSRISAIMIAAACAFCAVARGQVPIPIANAGFEADPVSEGCFQVLDVTDWDVVDSNGIMNQGVNVVGGLNLPVGSVWFPAGAPEGDHAAIVYLADSIGQGPMGLSQELTETLQPNTTYTLSAQVGNIASGTGPPPCDFQFFDLDNFPGYQVQLLAGGVVVGQDDNSLAGTLLDGEFGLSVTQICIGASHTQLGQTLEVRLINLNTAETPEDPGIEVDFDDVQLTRQPNGAALPSNLDLDCDVDLDDYTLLATCMAGPNQPPSPACPPGTNADIDNDGDVDLQDAAALGREFTGPM